MDGVAAFTVWAFHGLNRLPPLPTGRCAHALRQMGCGPVTETVDLCDRIAVIAVGWTGWRDTIDVRQSLAAGAPHILWPRNDAEVDPACFERIRDCPPRVYQFVRWAVQAAENAPVQSPAA